MNLSEENNQALNLIQAMIGAITPNFRVIGFNLNEDSIQLFFILQKDSQDDREEIEDIEFEFEALQSSIIDVDVNIIIEPGNLDNIKLPNRIIYRQKDQMT